MAKAPERNPLQGHNLASGADRDRTGDPLLAKQVLSQLSYRPDIIQQELRRSLAPSEAACASWRARRRSCPDGVGG